MASVVETQDGRTNTSGESIVHDASEEEQPTNSTPSDTQVLAKDVENVLRDTRLGGDLMWSLFVSAAKSYRFSSILHPFPPMYCEETGAEKHIIALREAVSRMPKFTADIECASQLPEDCHKLLSWVFQRPKFQLQLQDRKKCFSHIRSLVGQVMDAPEPTYVFEVVHDSAEESRFEARRGSRKFLYGYHGSRFDNFYSILHNGLNIHLNKVSAFGEGTYLSSELTVSLLYSQAGEAWSRSCVGAKLACVAVCQMIDDPSVKCQVKEGEESEQRQRAQASRITDAVPEKYYVVQNNDVVRVKYLLVYKDNSASNVSSENSSSYSWISQHKFPLLMLAYVVLLLAIGLANSRTAVKTVTNFFNRLKSS